MEGFWALIPPIWCNIGKILNSGGTLANKNIVSNFFEGFFYLWKRDGPKVSTFAPTLTLLFLLKMAEIGSNKQHCSKTLAIELSKYVKMKSLPHLPFPGKIRFSFAIFEIFLPGNRAESQVKGGESKFDKYCFIHTIPVQIPVKKCWFKYFPVLWL